MHNAAESLKLYGLEVFDASRLRVTLVEAGPRILPALPEKLAEAARAELSERGVVVMTGAQVASVSETGVHIKDGREVRADLTVWAAGVKGAPLLTRLDGLETDRLDRLLTRPTLQTTLDDRIYAIGDCASFIPPGAEKPLAPRAQAAHQMASAVFVNLVAAINHRPLKPFIYHDHGSLVSLSRYSTVGSLMGNLIGGRMAIEGRLARLFYVTLYRMHLIAIHGAIRGLAMIAVGHVNSVLRPKLKVH